MRQRLASFALACLVTAPVAAQTEPLQRLASQVANAPTVDTYAAPLPDSRKPFVITEHVLSGEPEPERVQAAATERVRYQYDDNSFESGLGDDGYAIQSAQRFRLRDTGTIRWLEACFWREATDLTSAHAFAFDVLSDRSGSPGSSLIGGRELLKSGRIASGQRDTCLRLNASQRVSARTIWVAVLYFGDEGIRQNDLSGSGKLLSGDTGSPRNTRVRARLIEGSGGQVTSVGSWRTPNRSNAVGIRIAVDHTTADPQPPPPDPTPDPEPPPPTYGPCSPTTDALQFTGGYRVRMCYVTPNGDTGQAKAGIWASGESGLLWFFNRDNAEALVKVLDGCTVNGYRWVFVAPVTDLGLSLRVTGPTGQTWDYTNSTGTTAPSRSDTRAFRCN